MIGLVFIMRQTAQHGASFLYDEPILADFDPVSASAMKVHKKALTIRDARPDELDEAAAVISAAYSEYASLISQDALERYVRYIADVRGRLNESDLIVAEKDSRIVGTVTFYPDGSLSQEEGWPSDYSSIRLLAVLPAARRGGIGRALFRECLQRARRRSVRYVGLHTTEFMSIARGLYERMGFQRAPQFDFEPRPGLLILAYFLEISSARGSNRPDEG